MRTIGKREQIEAWMRDKNTDILLVQETHVTTCSREDRKRYTWYFIAGDDPEKSKYAGVAIVIRNELKNYIHDIEPINERIMWITFGYVVPITFINVYFYTATHRTEDKQRYSAQH